MNDRKEMSTAPAKTASDMVVEMEQAVERKEALPSPSEEKPLPKAEPNPDLRLKAYRLAKKLESQIKNRQDLLKYGASVLGFLERAASGDTPPTKAQVTLGVALVEGRFNARDEKRGAGLIRTAALRGNIEAQFITAYTLLAGNSAMIALMDMCTDKSNGYEEKMRAIFDTAFENFPEVEVKNVSIDWAVGLFLEPPLAVRASMVTLLEVIAHEANRKITGAQLILALLKSDGRILPKDDVNAFNLIREAAKDNNKLAQIIYYFMVTTVELILSTVQGKHTKKIHIHNTYEHAEENIATSLLNNPAVFKLVKQYKRIDKKDPAFAFLNASSLKVAVVSEDPENKIESKEEKKEEAPKREESSDSGLKALEKASFIYKNKLAKREEIAKIYDLLSLAATKKIPSAQLIIALAIIGLKTKFSLETLNVKDISEEIIAASLLLQNPETCAQLKTSYKDTESSLLYAESLLISGFIKGLLPCQQVLDEYQRFKNPPPIQPERKMVPRPERKKVEDFREKKKAMEDNQRIIGHFLDELQSEIKKPSENIELKVLKKLLILVYVKDSVGALPNSAALKKISHIERNEEFWKVLCRGFMFGKGHKFFNLLRVTGVFAALFPPLSEESARDYQANMDCIADRLSLSDASLAELSRPLFAPEGMEVDKGRIFSMLIAKEAVNVKRNWARELDIVMNVDVYAIKESYGIPHSEEYFNRDFYHRVAYALNTKFSFFSKKQRQAETKPTNEVTVQPKR